MSFVVDFRKMVFACDMSFTPFFTPFQTWYDTIISEMTIMINTLYGAGVDVLQFYDYSYTIYALDNQSIRELLAANGQKLLVPILASSGGVLKYDINSDQTTNLEFIHNQESEFSSFDNANNNEMWLDDECLGYTLAASPGASTTGPVNGYYTTTFTDITRGLHGTTKASHTKGTGAVNKINLAMMMTYYMQRIDFIYGYYAMDDAYVSILDSDTLGVNFKSTTKNIHAGVRSYDTSSRPIIYGQCLWHEGWIGLTDYTYVDAIALYIYPWRHYEDQGQGGPPHSYLVDGWWYFDYIQFYDATGENWDRMYYEKIKQYFIDAEKSPKIYPLIQTFENSSCRLPTGYEVSYEINFLETLGVSGIGFFSWNGIKNHNTMLSAVTSYGNLPVTSDFVPNAILWPNSVVTGTKEQFKAMFEMYLEWGVNTLPIHPFMVQDVYASVSDNPNLEHMLQALEELGNPPLCLQYSHGMSQQYGWAPASEINRRSIAYINASDPSGYQSDYLIDTDRWHTFIDPEVIAHYPNGIDYIPGYRWPTVLTCPWYRGVRYQVSLDRLRELLKWIKPSVVWFNSEYLSSPVGSDYYSAVAMGTSNPAPTGPPGRSLPNCTRCTSVDGYYAGMKAIGDELVSIIHSVLPNCLVTGYGSHKRDANTNQNIYSPVNHAKYDQSYFAYESFNVNNAGYYNIGAVTAAENAANAELTVGELREPVNALNDWLLPSNPMNYMVKYLGVNDYPTLTQGHTVDGDHPENFYTDQEWYDLCYRIAQLGCPGFALWPSWVSETSNQNYVIEYTAAARRLIPVGIQAFEDYKNNTTRSYIPQVFAPNYFHPDAIVNPSWANEFSGEFWPGSGVGPSFSCGSIGEDNFQLMFGDYVFNVANYIKTYTWNGTSHTNNGFRTLPLIEEIDRPWLEYWIDTLCDDGDWVLLDEEYMEPWLGTTNQDRIDRWQAVMTLINWAQAYSRGEGIDQSKGNRNMKFGYWNVGPLRAQVWEGYGPEWGIGNDPGPGWSGWMSDWQDTGIEDADYNLHKAAALVDFYAPFLYIYDNSIKYWNMQLESVLYCLYDSNNQWTLPKKPVIPSLAPQVWGSQPGGSDGVPVNLDVLNKMIDDVYTIKRDGQLVFEKVYWYIASSVHSWGDPATGNGWWQLHPAGILPPQIQLIKNKTVGIIEGDDFRTAIANFQANSTITVGPGTFEIDMALGSLVHANGITIEGSGPETILRVKDGCGDFFSVFGGLVTTSAPGLRDVTYNNFTIDLNPAGYGGHPIITDENGVNRTSTTLAAAIVSYAGYDLTCTNLNIIHGGIWAISAGSGTTITNCTFTWVPPPNTTFFDDSTIYVTQEGSVGRGVCTVSDNIFNGVAFDGIYDAVTHRIVNPQSVSAIELHGGNCVGSGNKIYNYSNGFNIVSYSYYNGGTTLNPNSPSGPMHISDNVITGAQYGILLWSWQKDECPQNTLKDITITKNDISLSKLWSELPWTSGIAINFSAANSGIYENISATDNIIRFDIGDERTGLPHQTDAWSHYSSAITFQGGVGGYAGGTVINATQSGNVVFNLPATIAYPFLPLGPVGIGNKKFLFIIPPLIGSVEGMASSYATLEEAAALGYNGVVMTMTTGTQYSTDMIWSGVSAPNWPINAAAFRQKCTDLGFEFILGTFMQVCPNEGGYAHMDPIYFESIPVKNQRFKVSGTNLVIDDSEVRFQLPNMNWDGLPYWGGAGGRWWGYWTLGTCYGRPYQTISNGQPIFSTKDVVTVPPTGDDFSLNWQSPPTFVWQSNHAYTTGQVVIKNDRIFFVYAGGTSGNVEPNWSSTSLVVNNTTATKLDPLYPDNLVDGGVTWVYCGSPWFGMVSSLYIYPTGATDNGAVGGTEIVANSYVDFSFDLKYQNLAATRINFSFYGYYNSDKDAERDGFPSFSHKVYLDNTIINGGNRVATTTPGGTGYDMDWTRIHIPFNTIDVYCMSVSIEFADADGHTIPNADAQVWISNITTLPAGLLNISRRDKIKGDPTYATPIYMRSLDGNTTYHEGVDFSGAEDTDINLHDPKIWHGLNGGYDTAESVPDMTILPGSPLASLPEDTVVLLDYYHIGFRANSVWVCLAEPALYDFYESYIPKALAQWHPDAWFIETDEVRLLGWDKTCTDIGTVGEVLASNNDRLTTLIKAADPGKPIYIWSDMWDETHNGGERKYLLASDVYGSWEGLHSDTIIMNWFGEIPSLNFFYNKSFIQMISRYYDDHNFATTQAALFDYAATLGPTMINGTMYTTWQNDYTQIDDYMNFILPYMPAEVAATSVLSATSSVSSVALVMRNASFTIETISGSAGAAYVKLRKRASAGVPSGVIKSIRIAQAPTIISTATKKPRLLFIAIVPRAPHKHMGGM